MYSHYERLYREDIQAWLCNLYFRCDRMPKYTAGQLEYEVLLNYTGNLLSLKKQARRDNMTHQQLKDKGAVPSASGRAAANDVCAACSVLSHGCTSSVTVATSGVPLERVEQTSLLLPLRSTETH